MTARERIKALLPVIKAWADGNAVQYRRANSTPLAQGGAWSDWTEYSGEDEPAWSSARFEWRIKPKPREWWCVVGHDFTNGHLHREMHESRQEAMGRMKCLVDKITGKFDIVHVREVDPT